MFCGKQVRRFLDIGCGAGTYSWALLDALPDAQATLFDRENARGIVEEFAQSRNHTARMDFRGGDFFHDDLGGPYDLVILSNLIHCYGTDDSITLLTRISDSVSSKGVIAIKDIYVNSEHTAPHNALRFGVTMGMLTQSGDVYSPEEIRSMAERSGLVLDTTLPLDASPESVLYLLSKATD
jgi:trans-aconitate methyltransferase